MPGLVAFLESLLHAGRVVFSERLTAGLNPAARQEDAAAQKLLEKAYRTYQLDIAGPPLDFHELAIAAAEFMRAACWYLVQHDEPAEALQQRLTMPAPRSPAEHLSGDLLLRYLPQVHRRARAISPTDPLVEIVTKVLREWPLSGVLSDVADAPLTPLDFGGHSGLMMLYAERLVRHQKTEWLPTGPAREYVELVFHDHGQERSPFSKASGISNDPGNAKRERGQ